MCDCLRYPCLYLGWLNLGASLGGLLGAMGGVFGRVISTNGLPAMLLHALALVTFIVVGIGLLE